MRCLRLISPLLIACVAVNAVADSLDQPNFESLARNYRIHLYETYRTQRPEYNRRFEQAEQITNLWNKLDDEAQQQEVVQWFVEAQRTGNPPAVPAFVEDTSLVITKPKPRPKTQPLVATAPRQTTPSFQPTAIPRPTPQQDEQDKPGFFSALTRALVSKPDAEQTETTETTNEDVATTDFVMDESPSLEAEGQNSFNADETADLFAESEFPAEVSDETPFENDPAAVPEDALALIADVERFNGDCETVRSLFEDEPGFDLSAFSFGVSELERLQGEWESLRARLDDMTETADFPELGEIQPLVYTATERAMSPASWYGEGELSDEDQETLSSFRDRLSVLAVD